MRGGRSCNDDGVSLDRVNQLQGVSQAFCGAEARADWLECGAGLASATPTTLTSDRSVNRLRCSLPKAPRPASSRRRGRDDVAELALREFVNLDAAFLRYDPACSCPHAICVRKKDKPRAVEIAREGMMSSKAISCVHAIAAAGILMFSSYAATTAFGEDASGVPDSALKGKRWPMSPAPTSIGGAGKAEV
jgi:hypothetical protein